ncbi:MAG: 30S ribosomal protein S17 [Minisyncoccales bacterium]
MKHQLTGKVMSDKMAKTVVVLVERLKEHPKYHKRYKVSKKYKAHCETGEYKIGDAVVIEECRPMSADKRWKVAGKIAAAKAEEKEAKTAG